MSYERKLFTCKTNQHILVHIVHIYIFIIKHVFGHKCVDVVRYKMVQCFHCWHLFVCLFCLFILFVCLFVLAFWWYFFPNWMQTKIIANLFWHGCVYVLLLFGVCLMAQSVTLRSSAFKFGLISTSAKTDARLQVLKLSNGMRIFGVYTYKHAHVYAYTLVIYVYRVTYILHWHMFMSVFATVCINMHNYVVFLYQTTAWPNMICFMLHKIIPCCTVDAWGSHICCGRSSTLRSWYILSLPTSSDSRWDGPRAHNFGWHVSSLNRNCIYCILFIG
jgi:hypothetical protein